MLEWRSGRGDEGGDGEVPLSFSSVVGVGKRRWPIIGCVEEGDENKSGGGGGMAAMKEWTAEPDEVEHEERGGGGRGGALGGRVHEGWQRGGWARTRLCQP